MPAPLSHDLFEQVLLAIRLVSTSSQTSVEQAAEGVPPTPSFLLIPRDADRLDAIGRVGLERCLAFGIERGRPLMVPETPRPQTREELLAFATPQRFEDYKAGRSANLSTVDHFFDKLLHLTCNDSGNPYLAAQAAEAREEMITAMLEILGQGSKAL
jgi:uncharacterized protein